MKQVYFYLALAFLWAAPAYSQSFTCPSGTEDMLEYFVMGYPNRSTHYMGPGNANPIYFTIVPELETKFATSGYFVWVKGSDGYPWDVKTFDENYIYDRTTELTWTDPTSFKRFTHDLPLSHRCVETGAAGETIKVAPAKTSYSSYESCTAYLTQNLSYVRNEITAPTLTQTGGNLGIVKSRDFKYYYGCTSSYSCTDMEIFNLGYKVGIYEWRHYQNQSGTFVLVQTSNINQYEEGQATPYLPCSNSY